jgi:hypothetical protein
MKNFMLLVVPAIIALTMVTSAVFITIYHPDQTIPEFLVNSFTTIMGYYFGIGAAKS